MMKHSGFTTAVPTRTQATSATLPADSDKDIDKHFCAAGRQHNHSTGLLWPTPTTSTTMLALVADSSVIVDTQKPLEALDRWS